MVRAGIEIEFNEVPVQTVRRETVVPKNLAKHLDLEVQKFLDKGIIQITEPEAGDFYSTVFLREKKDGKSFRMIINLKPIKQFIVYRKFKMDTVSTCMQMITPNCYMASLDLKDAYYSLRVSAPFQKYLKFIWRGIHYKFVVLPMGLAPGPRQFTKITKPIVATLQSQGISITPYLDDMFLVHDTAAECEAGVHTTVQLFDKLGFHVNLEKSIATPVQRIEHLGFVMDSVAMTAEITEKRLSKMRDRASPLYGVPTVREVMCFVGTVESCMLGVVAGNMHKYRLEVEKNVALKRVGKKLYKTMTLSDKALQEVDWWLYEATLVPRPLLTPSVSVFMQTDASKKGWGACLTQGYHGEVVASAGGAWQKKVAEEHINVLELEAIWRGLTVLLPDSKLVHILVESDNTTAVAYVRKMGGMKYPCRRKAQKIWRWILARGCWLTSQFLPGEQNVKADKLSRNMTDGMEWMLDREVFAHICEVFGVEPEVDLFASARNNQTPKYMSFVPDTNAIAIDAMCHSWKEFNLCYVFCPFSLIARVVQKLQVEGVAAIMVIPNWPTAPWFSRVMRMVTCPPLKLPRRVTLLSLPTDPTHRHSLLPKMQLLAVKIQNSKPLPLD